MDVFYYKIGEYILHFKVV